ncbi:MAG: hypothetical protein MPJ78_01705 [Hyphomicrobiaceae bacterium]|nr:hypothetical protein [Hyphomicrobiaceae bacterium]
MTTSKQNTDSTDEASGLEWPKLYKAMLPVIREEWGIEGAFYLKSKLGGGLSGAMVFVVDITCRDFKGQAILKLDRAAPADWSEDEEFENHRAAIEAEPEYAAQHLPRLLHAARHAEQIAILSTIAGRGLEYAVPWHGCAYAQQLDFGRRVTADLLEKWNADYYVADGLLEPLALLESWAGYRLDPDEGRIGPFLMEECGLAPDDPSFSFQGEWYPNPLAFAMGTRPLPKKARLRAVRGRLHGDLHGNNILVAAPPRRKRQYYLIDLDLYRPNDFLFYDHAYLEFTTLLHTRPEVNPDDWNSILGNLSRFRARSNDSAPRSDDLGLLKLLKAMRSSWMAWVDRHEPNRLSNMESQLRLAYVAVGLIFSHRKLSPHQRSMAFTYAASNLKHYLQLNGIEWPTSGPAFEFPAKDAVSRITAPPVTPKSPTRTVAAKDTGSRATASRKRVGIMAALVLLLAGAGGAVWWHNWHDARLTSVDGFDFPDMDELSIAVLPFRAAGEQSKAAALAEGMRASLITSLDEVPQLVIVSNHADPVEEWNRDDIATVGKDLKVRYVLDGSVHENQDRIRVFAKLVEAGTGRVLWSKRFDRNTKDIFAVQDEIALEVLVQLQVKLTEGLQAALRGQSTANLDAFLLYAKGQQKYREFTGRAMQEVRRLMDQALKLDPTFSAAKVLKAKTHVADARLGHSKSAWESLTRASRILHEAAELDGITTPAERGEILGVDAYIDLLARRFSSAIKTGEEAVALVPDNADVTARFASILFYTGDYDRSIRLMKQAMRLSPVYPTWYPLYISRAYAFKGEYDEALIWAKDALRRTPTTGTPPTLQYANLAFIYWEAGRKAEAREAARKALEADPDFSMKSFEQFHPFRDQNDWQRMADAIKAAGIPA